MTCAMRAQHRQCVYQQQQAGVCVLSLQEGVHFICKRGLGKVGDFGFGSLPPGMGFHSRKASSRQAARTSSFNALTAAGAHCSHFMHEMQSLLAVRSVCSSCMMLCTRSVAFSLVRVAVSPAIDMDAAACR